MFLMKNAHRNFSSLENAGSVERRDSFSGKIDAIKEKPAKPASQMSDLEKR